MAKLCGLAAGDGADTVRRWEVTGPSGTAAELLRILAMASDRYPILEKFNVFDRFNIPDKQTACREGRVPTKDAGRTAPASGLTLGTECGRPPNQAFILVSPPVDN